MDSRKLNKNKNIYKKNFFNYMKTNIKFKNNTSKVLWDNLDNYFIWIFSELYSKKNIVNIFNWLVKLPYLNLIEKVKNKVNNIDAFYLEAIKNEFNDVKRDIVIQKKKYVWPNQGYHNNLINNHYYDNNNRGINITFNSGRKNFNSKIWTNNIYNERDDNLNFKLGYNEEIIKPYYRYMVPLFIMQSYFKFINNLGYTKLLVYFKRISNLNLNWIKNNNITILNYIIIKTLFDILRFNYRSLVRRWNFFGKGFLEPKHYSYMFPMTKLGNGENPKLNIASSMKGRIRLKQINRIAFRIVSSKVKDILLEVYSPEAFTIGLNLVCNRINIMNLSLRFRRIGFISIISSHFPCSGILALFWVPGSVFHLS